MKKIVLVAFLISTLKSCDFALKRGDPLFEKYEVKDSAGRLLEKSDGYFISKYDSLGRIILHYGNSKYYDDDQNFKELYIYSDSLLVKTEKHYYLKDSVDFDSDIAEDILTAIHLYENKVQVATLLFEFDFDSVGNKASQQTLFFIEDYKNRTEYTYNGEKITLHDSLKIENLIK